MPVSRMRLSTTPSGTITGAVAGDLLESVVNPVIKKTFEAEETFTEELCHITELSNSSDDAEVSIAKARVEPGVTTRWHRLVDTTERYVILEGSGRVEVGELQAEDVSAGDVIIIPPMCRQRITNTGEGDLVFFAICSPRFEQPNYLDIE